MTTSQTAMTNKRSDTNIGQSAYLNKIVTISNKALYCCQPNPIRQSFTTTLTGPYNPDANVGQRLEIQTT